MMISPEGFIESHKNKSYKELLPIRDKLMKEIRAFERRTYDPELEMISPSPEVVYQCNLLYLGKLCELIAEKYNQEYIWGDADEEDEDEESDTDQEGPADGAYLYAIRDFLEEKGLLYDSYMQEEISLRREGKKYALRDHVKGMIYSMLSAQTRWHRIQEHLEEIDRLFYNYEPDSILATDPEYFIQGLFEIKCGSRSTKDQMNALKDNIRNFQRIEDEYGSIDAFITSEPAEDIVRMLSKKSSKYKMKMFGEALAWEYLRNVGIDGAKPDTHLCRFLGADRMGTGKKSPATIKEVIEQVAGLSEKTGMSKVEIDNLIWSFCADGYGKVCTATPHCEVCPIRDWCNGG